VPIGEPLLGGDLKKKLVNLAGLYRLAARDQDRKGARNEFESREHHRPRRFVGKAQH